MVREGGLGVREHLAQPGAPGPYIVALRSCVDAWDSAERRSSRIRRHLRRHDLVRIVHRLAALDLVHVLHALRDLAPDRVLAVEEARVCEADEELAVAR